MHETAGTPAETAANAPLSLVAFDLDGTVFPTPTHQQISPRVAAALQAAHDAGAKIFAATGRPVWMLGSELPGFPWLDGAVSCSGARVTCSSDPSVDFATSIPRPLAIELLRTIEQLGGGVSIHTNRESFLEKRHGAQMVGELSGSRDELRRAGNPIDELARILSSATVDSALDVFEARPQQQQLDKIDCGMPTPEAADELAARMEELGGLEVARLNELNFEITAAGASKGAAIQRLCERLGIDATHAVAFGDSGNDLTMAGRTFTFVAMGNATDEVKAAADEVCDTVTRDGVARWLEPRLAEG